MNKEETIYFLDTKGHIHKLKADTPARKNENVPLRLVKDYEVGEEVQVFNGFNWISGMIEAEPYQHEFEIKLKSYKSISTIKKELTALLSEMNLVDFSITQ